MKNLLEASARACAGANGEYGLGEQPEKKRVLDALHIQRAVSQNSAQMLGEDASVDMERLILAFH